MATSKSKKQSAADSAEPRPNEGAAGGEAAGAGGDAAERVKPTGVTGPGTGAASPADEQDRTPSMTVLPTEAGPLVPTDVKKVHEPADGHPESSTNSLTASAALRSIAGANHIRLHDDQGNDIALDDIFTEPDGASRMVTVRRRVLETYTQPKARTPSTHLLYNVGARVTLAEAERFKAAKRALLGASEDGS